MHFLKFWLYKIMMIFRDLRKYHFKYTLKLLAPLLFGYNVILDQFWTDSLICFYFHSIKFPFIWIEIQRNLDRIKKSGIVILNLLQLSINFCYCFIYHPRSFPYRVSVFLETKFVSPYVAIRFPETGGKDRGRLEKPFPGACG